MQAHKFAPSAYFEYLCNTNIDLIDIFKQIFIHFAQSQSQTKSVFESYVMSIKREQWPMLQISHFNSWASPYWRFYSQLSGTSRPPPRTWGLSAPRKSRGQTVPAFFGEVWAAGPADQGPPAGGPGLATCFSLGGLGVTGGWPAQEWSRFTKAKLNQKEYFYL